MSSQNQATSNQNSKAPHGKGNFKGSCFQKGNGNKSNKTKYKKPIQSSKDKFKGETPDLEGFYFDCTTRKQTEECNKTLRKIATYVGKEWRNGDLLKYVVEHLERPQLMEPEDVNENASRAEQFKWQERFKRFLEKEEAVESGIKKLYSLIWGQCTEVMRNELKASPDFKATQKTEDAIKLIQSIRGITFSFRDQKYVPGSIWKAYTSVFNQRQREDQDPQDHLERFNDLIEVLKNYGVSIGEDEALIQHDEIFTSLSEAQQEEPENIQAAKERAKQQFLGYGLLISADKKRYGDLITHLDNSFVLGDDKYPRSVNEAYNQLMHYNKQKMKEKKNETKSSNGLSFATNTNKKGKGNKGIICHECKEPGHIRPDCPRLKNAIATTNATIAPQQENGVSLDPQRSTVATIVPRNATST